MKKTTSKLLSVLLALVMIAGMLPMTALAATDTVATWTELLSKFDTDGDKTITIPTGTTVTVTGQLTVPPDGEYTLTGGGTLRRDNASFEDMIYVYTGAKLTLEDVTLDGDGIPGELDLVWVHGGEFTVSGGSIAGNTGDTAGGVGVVDGEFTMTGGSVTGNTGDTVGGVYVGNYSTFNMNGGSITGNTGEYGGVYLYASPLNVSGGATVTGNKGVGGTARNVYLYGDVIHITDTLTGSIGITVDGDSSPTTVAWWSGEHELTEADYKADVACLFSDGGYKIRQEYNAEDGYYYVEMDNPIAIRGATVTLEGEGFSDDGDGGYYTTYNGKTQKPTAVTVEFEGEPLIEGEDYTWQVTGVDNLYSDYYPTSAGKNVGWVELTITGKGAYSGKMTMEYLIAPKALTIKPVTVKDFVYGSPGNPEVDSVAFDGLVGSDTLAPYADYMAGVWFLDDGNVGSNAVEVEVWLTYSQKASNYTIDGDDEFTTTCTVTAATLTGVVSIGVVDEDDSVIGTIDAGDVLTAEVSTNSDGTAVLAYQWYRDGDAIGTNSSTYTIASGAGASITVTVTASGNYTGSLTSAPVVVGKTPLGGAVSITGIAGTPTTGNTLTLSSVGLGGATFDIRWYRDGEAISGATSDTYTLQKADLGKRITVVVTGAGEYTGTHVAYADIDPTAPDAPKVTATPGNGQVTLNWATPFDGSSPIAYYAIFGYEGNVVKDNADIVFYASPTATSYTVTGLTNGQEYTCVLAVVNSVAPAMSNPVTATPTAGGGGDGGGGGGAPTTPTLPAAEGTVSVDYSQSGGEVALTLPDSKIAEIIGKSDGAAVLDLSGIKDATSATLPKAALGAFAEAGLDVEIKLPQGAVTLSGEAAASVAGQAGGADISVELKTMPTSSLNEAQREAVNDGDTVIDISILSGTQNISTFDGVLTVSIPYSGELPAAVWYLNDAGELEKLSCVYDAATKTVSFTLDHLSLYVVGLDTNWVNPFTDVSENDWFYENVKYAVTHGLFNGTSATTFSPHGSMTRAMFATVLARLDGTDLSGYTTSRFSDVPLGQYYSAAIEWAADKGIVDGVGDGKFDPNASITREQMAVMLYNYIEYKSFKLPTSEVAAFADEASIASWAKAAVKAIQAVGIINGKPGNLYDPQCVATRAEVATIFARFAETLAK